MPTHVRFLFITWQKVSLYNDNVDSFYHTTPQCGIISTCFLHVSRYIQHVQYNNMLNWKNNIENKVNLVIQQFTAKLFGIQRHIDKFSASQPASQPLTWYRLETCVSTSECWDATGPYNTESLVGACISSILGSNVSSPAMIHTRI